VNVDHPDSPEFKAHLLRIGDAMNIMVNLMDNPSVLMKEVEHLANQHAAVHVEGMKGVYITVSLSNIYMAFTYKVVPDN